MLTATGRTLGEVLDWWQSCDRRHQLRNLLRQRDGIQPDDVIMSPETARQRGLTSTVCFPVGNLCPEGSVIKATAIDPAVVDADGVYRHTGSARVFTTERDAIAALKGRSGTPVKAGDVVVLMGRGPLGSGMEETYQLTSALKYVEWGRHVAIVTDARFSGVSTGSVHRACGARSVGGRSALAKVRDGDWIRIEVDRLRLTGRVDMVGTAGRSGVGRRRQHACWRSGCPIPICGPIPTCPTRRGCGPPCSGWEAAPGADASSMSIGSSPHSQDRRERARRLLDEHAAVVDVPLEDQHDQRNDQNPLPQFSTRGLKNRLGLAPFRVPDSRLDLGRKSLSWGSNRFTANRWAI